MSDAKDLFNGNINFFNYLKKSRLFEHLDDDVLEGLVPISRFEEFSKGDVILEEGQINDRVYFLIEGQVSIRSHGELILNLRRLGDIFGEISIIDDRPCVATVTADCQVKILSLEAKIVGTYTDKDPENIQNALYRIFAKIMTQKLFLTTNKAREYEKTNRLLKASQEELEVRVQERTEALVDANEKLHHEIQHREALETQLRHSEKMEAMGTLAGGIAHEFNNLLQGMFIGMDMMDYSLSGDSKLRMPLQNAKGFGDRAKQLVQQVLAFSHQEDGRKERLNLTSVLQSSFRVIRTSLPTSVALHLDLKLDPCFINGNRMQVQQILTNLCSNAEYAMQDNGGTLSVGLHFVHIDDDEIAEYQLSQAGNYVCLMVADSGCGIPQDIQDRVFDPFFTTKPVGDGSGLGLSIVYGLTKHFDGSILWESKVDEGTCFRLYFPLLEDEETSGGRSEE